MLNIAIFIYVNTFKKEILEHQFGALSENFAFECFLWKNNISVDLFTSRFFSRAS